jgi:hypothetical protein
VVCSTDKTVLLSQGLGGSLDTDLSALGGGLLLGGCVSYNCHEAERNALSR